MLHVLYIIINSSGLGRESKIREYHATSYGSLCLWCKQEVREFSPFVRFTFCVRKVYQKQIQCRNSCCFGLCIQFYDLFEGDLYRPDQD